MQRKISLILCILFIITVLILATLIGKTNNISVYLDPVFVPQIIVRSAIVDWGFPQVTLAPIVY